MDIPGVEKEIDIGADVVGSDGEKLGTVRYVVARPPDMHITDIVVRTGVVLGREIVVPARLIHDIEDGKLYLSIDKETLKSYPDYIEIDYRMPPPGWVPPPDFYYPPAAVLLPPVASVPELETIRVNTPPGTRGIREGMDVETSDGYKVGSVDAVDVDLSTDKLKGFVVKHGFLFTRDTWIPANDVREISDDKVILRLTKDQIQQIEREQQERRG